MKGSSSAVRHRIFVLHLWVCAPFLAIWLYIPEVRAKIAPADLQHIQAFIVLIWAYMALRTWLAFRSRPLLNWVYVFPPLDVAIVSTLMYLGSRDPLSNVALLYFFPLAEAASSLNVAWAGAVAAMIVAGTALASHGFHSEDPFNAAFRYYFVVVIASLVTWLARLAASAREQLSLARDRNRIAMEMHDGVQGHLVSLSRQLELIEHVAELQPSRASEISTQCRQTARLASDELRFLVQRFRAPSLAEGFQPALQSFAANQIERNGLELAFEAIGDARTLGPETENALFRIAQEALNNILKHAGASKVKVGVAYALDSVTLRVEDDGVGFDIGTVTPSGLDGLKSRVAAVGGHVSIASEPGRGTVIEATVPRAR